VFTDDLTIFDYSVFAILVLSILLSMVRGVVREILSLAGWVVAFMVANSFAAGFAPLLPSSISGESLRLLLAFAALFLSSLLAMGLITMLISALVKTVGLGFADRFMGSLFGFARGLLVVLLMVLAAGFTALPQEPFWKKAVLSKPLEMAAMMVIPWLPRDLSKRISYVKTEA
jgi:membrane protein required for colicin V production